VQIIHLAYIFNVNFDVKVGGLQLSGLYEGWNFNSGNYLFTTDTK